VQTDILTKVVGIEADVKLILSSSAQRVENIKDRIPEHPVSSLEQLQFLEAWTNQSVENRELLVRRIHLNIYIFSIYLNIEISKY